MPSGLLVFACAMLPTLRTCSNDPDGLPGLVLPPLWPLYMFALGIAITVVRWPRSRLWGWFLLGMIWGVGALAIVLVVLEAIGGDTPALYVAYVGGAAALVVAPTIGTYREALVARASAIVAGGMALVFGALSTSPDFLWGVWVACGAAIALGAGCVWWWLEARKDGAL